MHGEEKFATCKRKLALVMHKLRELNEVLQQQCFFIAILLTKSFLFIKHN